MTDFLRPATVEDALALMAAGGVVPLAGGTDLYPATQRRALPGLVLDVTGLPGLCGITTGPAGLRIGAATTWTALARATLPPALAALQQAAVEVGGIQIQNAGTIGGNLCNASPAADGVPPLLVLDTEVELVGHRGIRRLPLSQFLTGPRQTARQADELLTALHIPASALSGQSHFRKLGARAYLVISIAMVAVRLDLQAGRISHAALAVGACSATACRLPQVESALTGAPAAEAPALIRDADVAAALSPLDDLRATAAYRSGAAAELLRRSVATLCQPVPA
ncbi:FAD binding domain-containing protein [Szabonella alba]|uniref:FAD binding domain-containing protein n=1 Tax=Szabonella alba TaxID=2804194 RepID=A0A8K0VAA1_9RHOB|nr:FAD binding domain-containing protein [Szabonella alba]MBL4916513.1 FAD binding domain-containing protein [Szabonella alba]